MNEATGASPDQPQSAPEQKIDPADIASVMVAIRKGDDDEIKKALSAHVQALVAKHKMDKYKLIILFDEKDEISNWHADRIYSAATGGESKDILLVIHSTGGSVEAAYLISKTCIRLSKVNFVVAVPRKAKSAATLISLGADEIHMGLMSELGPIDPQFGGFPALAMQNALRLLADLSCKYPGSSEMWGRFLSEKLDLRILGYFERVSESAVQYAERLLEGKVLPKGQTPKVLADHFVNHYKDHGFVIDADEAKKLLGDKIAKQNTAEYRFANELHGSLDLVKVFLDFIGNKDYDYVGGVEDGIVIRKKKER